MLQVCRIPVLLLYSLFFTVQVFFNFDIPHSNRHLFNNGIAAQKQEGQMAVRSVHPGKQKETHSKIRLNKRFQPSAAPAILPFSIAAPVYYIESRNTAVYCNPFHATNKLRTPTLRGPPAVVYCFV